MAEIIRIEDATYTYPLTEKPAIENISLSFEKGKFYGIIGANASGKTTLCNLIRGLCPNFYRGTLEGQVLFNGIPLSQADEQRIAVEIGFVFQNPFLQISGIRETVFEEVGLGLENLGLPRGEILERVMRVSKSIHIEELLDKNPMELSGGQCQRVAFASIIAMDADVMVIDEPTSQLDPEGTKDIFEIIRHLKKRGKTIILVEHKIDMIAQYCDEVVVLQEGKITAKGMTREVLTTEGLEKTGAPRPSATEFGYAMRNLGYPLAHIPITNREAAELIKGRRE